MDQVSSPAPAEPSVVLKVSGKTVYAAIMNILKNEHGLNREAIVRIIEAHTVKAVEAWLERSDRISRLVDGAARATIERWMATKLQDEVRHALGSKISIKVG